MSFDIIVCGISSNKKAAVSFEAIEIPVTRFVGQPRVRHIC